MKRLTRRQALVGAAATLGLFGCGDSRLGRTLVDAYRLSVSGFPDIPISRNNISNLPYASIAAKIGKGPRSILILWSEDRGELNWLSADNAAIVTRGGRVVRTAGFPETLVETRVFGPDPVAVGLQEFANNAVVTRLVDIRGAEEHHGLPLKSEFRPIGPTEIQIADLTFDTILVEERVEAAYLNWHFTNLYWVDPVDGFVWKSRQQIARTFPPVEIEVLKPAA